MFSIKPNSTFLISEKLVNHTYTYSFDHRQRLLAIHMKSTNVSDHHASISVPDSKRRANPVQNGGSIESKNNSLKNTLCSKGYTFPTRISKALQGSIWESTKGGQSMVIKTISKDLYHKRIAYSSNSVAIHIQEDIIKETAILKYLTENNAPSSVVKFIDFFEDTEHYYLVMENGGSNLFAFVKRCHQLIENGLLPLSEWRSFCKKAMQQMVELLDWMHNTMQCCHLDISLENFVIHNVNVVSNPNTNTILKFENDFQIKIIDFGLAEVFCKRDKADFVDFECNKYVGKRGYKCPEVTAERGMFDARSNDCWGLGVCFFILVLGFPPFQRACCGDAFFRAVMNGELLVILRNWGRAEYVNLSALDLIHKIFVPEKYRLNIREIQKHPYFVL
eukprot:599267_1